MLFKVTLERDQLQTVRVKQRHIRHRRLVVCIYENLEIWLEIKRILMQETGIQCIVSGHSLDQRRIEGDLFLRLGDIHETDSRKTGNFLRWSGCIGVSEFCTQHLRI